MVWSRRAKYDKNHLFLLLNFNKSYRCVSRYKIVEMLTLCSDGDQFDSLAGNEVQGFVHVVDLVDPHLASLRLR